MKTLLPRIITVLLTTLVVLAPSAVLASDNDKPTVKSQTISPTTTTTLKPVDVVAQAPARPHHEDVTKDTPKRVVSIPNVPGTTAPWPIQGDPAAEARAEYHSSPAYHDGPWSPAAQLK